jgi:hypothetical protein
MRREEVVENVCRMEIKDSTFAARALAGLGRFTGVSRLPD